MGAAAPQACGGCFSWAAPRASTGAGTSTSAGAGAGASTNGAGDGPAPAAAAPVTHAAEVVIVGAGLAGLACALRLKEHGVDCVLVEARAGVGGRASRGGADFVHGQHVATWRYLRRFGLTADGSLNGWHELREGGPECWVYVDGELKGPKQVHSEPNRLFFARFDELVEEWIEAGREDAPMLDLASLAFDHDPTADERRLMNGMMAEWHAADLADVGIYEDDLGSERIKALAAARPSLLDDDGDEGHWRILGGHQGLAERMAKEQCVHLSTVVRKVAWDDAGATVDCGDSVFAGKAVVVTVPLACIPDLDFQPALPAEKRRAVEGLGRGVTTTVHLRFRERFWPQRLAFLFHTMSSQCFWPGRGQNVLTAYFGGAHANAHLLSLDDKAMTDEILRQLGVIMGARGWTFEKIRSVLLSSEVHRWDTDPFSKMSYSYCPVGAAPLRAALAAPCGRVFWAGEATHPTKASYAHGALEEGERAAEEVLAALRPAAG